MIKEPFTLSIIRENRIDENRVPLIPTQVSNLLGKYPNLKVLVQPSKNRCFKDEDYLRAGAELTENISKSDIIFGVKEIDSSKLIENASYIFFSHLSKIKENNNQPTQGTPGVDKKKLLKEILRKKVTLIDYENIRDNLGLRYLGFGRFAGIVGCYNTLNLYLILKKKQVLPRVFKVNNYKKIKELIRKQKFGKIKILVTGYGRAAKGCNEILKLANIKQVSLTDYLNKKYEKPIFCNISAKKNVERIDGKNVSDQDFILNPHEYKSKIRNYLFDTDIFFACHYWDPRFPKIFSFKEIKKFKNLWIIGDITCDINGSVPTTIRSTSIAEPYYSIDVDTFKEVSIDKKGIAVMAVDNLPSELPRESSEDFGNGIISEVLPYLIKKDDGRINRATITSQGNLCEKYSYLENFIK